MRPGAIPIVGIGPKANQKNLGAPRREGELPTLLVPLFDPSEIEPSPNEIHSKLPRELYRGTLQEDLASSLAGRSVVVVGHDLVDTRTGEILETKPGEDLHLYHAAAHQLAAHPKHRWVGYRLNEDKGTVAPLGGASWSISSRTDPSYQARLRLRARKKTFDGLKRVKKFLPVDPRKRQGYRLRLVTLTHPDRKDLPRLAEHERHNRAHEFLRDTAYWKDRVLGGTKNIEDSGINGPHVHSHNLLMSRYTDKTALAWEWTGAVLKATREMHGEESAEDPRTAWIEKGWNLSRILTLSLEASRLKARAKRTGARDHQLEAEKLAHLLDQVRKDCFFVDVRLVVNKANPGSQDQVALEDAVQEATKYCTKTSDLAKLDPRDLLYIEMTKRWPRSFELLGAAREDKRLRRTILPTMEDLAETLAGAVGAENRADTRLDTAAISSAEGVGSEAQTCTLEQAEPPREVAKPPPKRPRAPSWRDLMHQLSLSEWIAVMRARAESAQRMAFRRLKEAGIWAWTLEEAMNLGELPLPESGA